MKLRHAELVTTANPRLPGKSAGVIGVVSSALLGHGFIFVLINHLAVPAAISLKYVCAAFG